MKNNQPNLETLRSLVKDLNYPEGLMRPALPYIEGDGFFPGASGLLEGDHDISERKFLILGQDQDNEKGYKRSRDAKDELYSSTWRNMKDFFKKGDIQLDDCFFTNAIMGIRVNAKSNLGRSPAFDIPEFMVECKNILQETIDLQRPKAIICLGIRPMRFLTLLSGDYALRVFGKDTFKEIDAADTGLCHNVVFDHIEDYSCSVLILTHPSYRKLNANKRVLQGAGNDSLLEDVLVQKLLNSIA